MGVVIVTRCAQNRMAELCSLARSMNSSFPSGRSKSVLSSRRGCGASARDSGCWETSCLRHVGLTHILQRDCEHRLAVREVVRWLQMSDSRLASLAAQETVHVVADHDMEAFGTPFDSAAPFRKLCVRSRREVVDMGVDDLMQPPRANAAASLLADSGAASCTSRTNGEPFVASPAPLLLTGARCGAKIGQRLSPRSWHRMLESDPDVILLDVRNEYETSIGTFRGAIAPHTTAFSEWPEYASSLLEQHRATNGSEPKVAMFCTGGVRCEKASAFLIQKLGITDVRQLEGGILSYMRQISVDESLWQGECYVFDRRAALDHELRSSRQWCFNCRRALAVADRQSPLFEEGVSCAHCSEQLTDERREAFRKRQLQFEQQRHTFRSGFGEKPQ